MFLSPLGLYRPSVFLSPILEEGEEAEEEEKHTPMISIENTMSVTSYMEVNNSSTVPDPDESSSENELTDPCDQRSPQIYNHPLESDTSLLSAQSRERIQICHSESDTPLTSDHRSHRLCKYPSVSDYTVDSDQRALRTHSLQRNVVESQSGRKRDDVEVVKQKYINSEIQDMPRRVDGPIQYGHLHRSRSSHINVGSQDLRSQTHRHRYKLGTSFFTGHEQENAKKDFRCKKLGPVSVPSKSAMELLYGDLFSTDDTDPELSALFDDNQDECEHTVYQQDSYDPFTAAPRYDDSQEETGHDSKQRTGDCMLPCDENKDAFLRGFFEGFYHGTGVNETGAEQLEATLQQSGQTVQSSNDPYIENTSHVDLIKSIQDKTHKFLKDWEKGIRSSPVGATSMATVLSKSPELSKFCSACKAYESKSRKNNASVMMIAKKTLDFPGPSALIPTLRQEKIRAEPRFLAPLEVVPPHQLAKSAEDPRNIPPTQNNLVVNMRSEDTPDLSKQTAKTKRRPKSKSRPMLEIVSASARTNPKECEKKTYSFCDKESSIVTMAKRRFEHKDLSSLALEDLQKSVRDNKSKTAPPRLLASCTKDDTTDTKPTRFDDTTTPPAKEKTMYAPSRILVIPFCSLEGWVTKTSQLCDETDCLHLSNSELLHPVESYEKFAATPKTPSSSSLSLSMRKDANEMADTPGHGKSTHALYESSAFKHKPIPLFNYMKATELAKLRLTKSCDVSKGNDKSFANVPLARCMSYAIEQKLQNQTQATTCINLSEKLAQQLKNMGKDKHTKQTELRLETPIKADHQKKLESTGGESNDRNGRLSSRDLILPKIKDLSSQCQNVAKNEKGFTAKGKAVKAEAKEDRAEFPHIAVTGLQAKKPIEVNGAVNDIHGADNLDIWRGGGIAVRAESCVSPYNFDKSDPNKIMLKATSLPPMHSVCTHCGCINEMFKNTSGRGRPRRSSGAGINHEKGQHEYCCSPQADSKWRLEQNKSDTSFEDPKVEVSKVSYSNTDKHHVMRRRREKQLHKSFGLSPQEISNGQSNSHHDPISKTAEHTFNLPDHEIKVKFAYEVELDSGCFQNRDNIVKNGSHYAHIEKMAAPVNRDKMECPITRETRIYKEKKRSKNDETTIVSEVYLTPCGSPSPYLEYLKRKADLTSVRASQLQQTFSENSSDTTLNSPKPEASDKHKRFPVMPIKKVKRTTRKQTRLDQHDQSAGPTIKNVIVGLKKLPLLTSSHGLNKQINTPGNETPKKRKILHTAKEKRSDKWQL